ncbi:neo-calmodulin-like [Dreissena polymorpha]|uniref:EF-hand domain-containing protein n=1 Tax=Dreissena polymorpha TaxID=45954 RepID=A0A9D4J8D2_DREPO|nr:neo-calmodulin-like [Dreissena polymorpha]KAH3802310.1 hypothetical protein DPMN_155985 [Dreissena polymorpha]
MASTEKRKNVTRNKKEKGIQKVKPAIDEIFDQMDQNHDGRISVHELKKAARLLGLNPTLKEAEQMIEDCNPREKGYVARAEFRKLFESKEKDMGMQVEQIKAAFKVFDKDNSGALTRDEILSVLRLAGDKVDDAELDDMISRVDVDGDGKISIEEFAELVCNT